MGWAWLSWLFSGKRRLVPAAGLRSAVTEDNSALAEDWGRGFAAPVRPTTQTTRTLPPAASSAQSRRPPGPRGKWYAKNGTTRTAGPFETETEGQGGDGQRRRRRCRAVGRAERRLERSAADRRCRAGGHARHRGLIDAAGSGRRHGARRSGELRQRRELRVLCRLTRFRVRHHRHGGDGSDVAPRHCLCGCLSGAAPRLSGQASRSGLGVAARRGIQRRAVGGRSPCAYCGGAFNPGYDHIPSDEVPAEIIRATCETAVRELAAPSSLMQDLERGGAISRSRSARYRSPKPAAHGLAPPTRSSKPSWLQYSLREARGSSERYRDVNRRRTSRRGRPLK
ncbi:hypothetical protein Rpal_2329 [Rhodopseudomonas palustris TIE-1]|nr:hypothetical protein Rpal_2329 [Rhodopseudomonas palustris TIE-1]